MSKSESINEFSDQKFYNDYVDNALRLDELHTDKEFEDFVKENWSIKEYFYSLAKFETTNDFLPPAVTSVFDIPDDIIVRDISLTSCESRDPYTKNSPTAYFSSMSFKIRNLQFEIFTTDKYIMNVLNTNTLEQVEIQEDYDIVTQFTLDFFIRESKIDLKHKAEKIKDMINLDLSASETIGTLTYDLAQHVGKSIESMTVGVFNEAKAKNVIIQRKSIARNNEDTISINLHTTKKNADNDVILYEYLLSSSLIDADISRDEKHLSIATTRPTNTNSDDILIDLLTNDNEFSIIQPKESAIDTHQSTIQALAEAVIRCSQK